jgi:glutathione peroxidase-family protein
MPSIYDFELKNAAGETTTIPKAKATVIVNTASACGYTKHYAGLQVYIYTDCIYKRYVWMSTKL